jgi:hypothetical protein
VNLYYDLTGKARVFGPLVLPVGSAMYDVFSQYGYAAALACGNAVSRHAQFMLFVNWNPSTSGIANNAVWSSLFEHDSNMANGGAIGISVDYSRVMDLYTWNWLQFIDDLESYFGDNVNVFQVNDAFSIGNPRLSTRKRSADEMFVKRQAQICATPPDLRQYFTQSTPSIPDAYSYC